MHKRLPLAASRRSCHQRLNQYGATYVEMAISLIVFMLITISVVELLRFSYINVTLQHVVNDSMRNLVVLNFSDLDDASCNNREKGLILGSLTDPVTRKDCSESDIIRQGNKFGLTIKRDQIRIKSRTLKAFELGQNGTNVFSPPSAENIITAPCDPATAEENGTHAGNPGDYVSICVEIPTTVVIGIDTTIRAFAIARNEDFKTDE